MSFFLETTEMDLGDTPIENIFINDYMPMANGTYVKVYLLGFKYASDKEKKMEVNNEVLAKHLQIPLSDVLNAWNFWEEKGIIEKTQGEDEYNYGIKFLSLKQLYIKNTYGAQHSRPNEPQGNIAGMSSVEDIFKSDEARKNREMFNDIDDIREQPLSMKERTEVLGWLDKTSMDRDVIKQAFQDAKERSVLSINYVREIVKGWSVQGIKNLEDVADYYEQNNRRYYQYKKIMKSLGHFGGATESQMKLIDKWLDEYEFSMEIVLEACLEAGKKTNPSVNYVDAILADWHEKSVRTVEDARVAVEEHSKGQQKEIAKSHRVQRRSHDVSNRFHNFEQRTDSYTEEELEEVARRKREQYIRELKGEA